MIEANRIGDDMIEPLQVTAVEEAEHASDNPSGYNVLCPVNRPAAGGSDRAIVSKGRNSVFEFNVLEPYTGKR